MGKIIGLTYDVKPGRAPRNGQPKDLYAEFDHPAIIESVVDALESSGHKVVRIGNAEELLEKIDKLDVDIVFNLSEGLLGRNRESQVPILLEMKGIPFVGSDGLTLGLTLDKIMAKKIFISEKIPTPCFMQSNSVEDLVHLNGLKFPLIVKPRFEGSSKGLDKKAKVDDLKSLEKRVDYITKTYDQPALVEEFIKGWEFTVALIGNDESAPLPPVQVKIDGRLKLGEMFYTFARISSNKLEYVCPAKISKELDDKLRKLAYKTYKSVDCLDFGRVDFRVDEDGNPYVLEVNPLPSLAVEDVFAYIAEAQGTTYAYLINRIVEEALKRNKIE